MNGVTLITCTGMRAESLRRCSRYVTRFRHDADTRVQWVVVDDGDVQTFVPYLGDDAAVEEKLVRPAHRWAPGMNTLALNILAAIPHVKWDAVMFIEDDDHYHHDYMRTQLARLEKDELVGEATSRYYHLPTRRWRVIENTSHASLCQTAMRKSMLPVLADICRANELSTTGFIDWSLWKAADVKSKRLHHGDPLVTGMKGLPGRPGIGIGHRPELGAGWTSDADAEKLREWLGDDAEAYLRLKTTPERADNRATEPASASVG